MIWFDDKYGHFVGTLPADCVRECSAQGAVDEAVEYWTDTLGFEVPRDKAIDYLASTGGWPRKTDKYDTGLEDMSDTDLAHKVLWLACCDIKESGEWFGLTN